jgi:hypothetical protein
MFAAEPQAPAAAPPPRAAAPPALDPDNALQLQQANEQAALQQQALRGGVPARSDVGEGGGGGGRVGGKRARRPGEPAALDPESALRPANEPLAVLPMLRQLTRRPAQDSKTATLQRRAEAAEARVLDVQREAREAAAAAEAAAAGIPALIRAAEGVAGAVGRAGLRELLALEGALAVAAETIRAERTRRARRTPEGFICPISQAPRPAPRPV